MMQREPRTLAVQSVQAAKAAVMCFVQRVMRRVHTVLSVKVRADDTFRVVMCATATGEMPRSSAGAMLENGARFCTVFSKKSAVRT